MSEERAKVKAFDLVEPQTVDPVVWERLLDDYHRKYDECNELASQLAAAEARAVRCEGADRLEPIKYRVLDVPSRIENGEAIGMHVEIEQRLQRNGKYLWAVTDNGLVLNSSGEWEYEPIPSSRTDPFITRTRFVTLREALQALDAAR